MSRRWASKRVAVTSVSRTRRNHRSKNVYCRLRERSYEVITINPDADQVQGPGPGSSAYRGSRVKGLHQREHVLARSAPPPDARLQVLDPGQGQDARLGIHLQGRQAAREHLRDLVHGELVLGPVLGAFEERPGQGPILLGRTAPRDGSRHGRGGTQPVQGECAT
jgi:hypothetical protein